MRQSVGWLRDVLLAGALVGLFGLATSGSVRVSVLSPAREAGPGEFVTHVFSLANQNPTATDFLLELVAPPRWGLLGVPSSVSLSAGEEGTLFITVTVPPGALAGPYRLVLEAVSESDPNDTGSAMATVSVRAENEVGIILPAGSSVIPGDETRYDVAVVNRGNAQDTYRMEVASASSFKVDVSPALVSLGPQERGTFEIRVAVPAGAHPGRDVLSVEAVSTVYAGVKDGAVLFMTILPPPPQAVGGTLLEELPARLELAFAQDVITGRSRGELAFSMAGVVGDGYLYTSLRAAPLFGPDPVEASSVSIYYKRTPATYAIGDVSSKLTDLLSLSCRGGSMELEALYTGLAFLAGADRGEIRAGGAFVLGPEAARVGIAHTDRRLGDEQKTAWSVTAACQPLADVRLRLEGALGLDGMLSSRAFFFNATVDTPSYFASADAFSVGTYFPELLKDQAGINLSQRLRASGFSFAVSVGHRFTNVIRDPLVPRTTTDELGLNGNLLVGDEWPTVAGTLAIKRVESTGATPWIDLGRLASFSVSRNEGAFPYSLSWEWKDQYDELAGTHLRRLAASEGAGLSLEGLYVFLRVAEEGTIDLASGAPLSGGTGVSLLVRPQGTLHSASLTWTNDRDAYALSCDLDAQIVESLHAAFRARLNWDRTFSTPVTFECGITFELTFDLPVPFLVTKGRLEGRVFDDRDGDGRLGPTERGVGRVVVAAGGNEVSTDEKGYFRFPPLAPGLYTLDVSGLPPALAAETPPRVELRAGLVPWIDLPLTPVVLVSGVVFDDADRSGTFQETERGFAGVHILLGGADGTALGDAYTDSTGRFEFPYLRPGTYRIGAEPATLPQRFAFTTPSEVVLSVEEGTAPVVCLGGIIKPKAAVITFQPPTADFEFTPDDPQARAAVHFDASSSIAFGSQIVLFEWDWNGDGATDAVGKTSDHAFEAPGSYPVTLTVTDGQGNSDSITNPVTVR